MPVFKLRGRVAPGMFPDEIVVVLKDGHDADQAVIVRADEVQKIGDDVGVIQVHLIDRDGGFSVVRLPGELISAGRVLSVRDGQLEAVA